MDFYKQAGALILGTRLKRLSERILNDISLIYAKLSIDFEPSWFPVFFLLNKNKRMSISEIAKILGITHSAVSQMVNVLRKRKLVRFIKDNGDQRKKVLEFTPEGSQLTKELISVWFSLENSTQNMLNEGKHCSNLFNVLDEMENILQNKSLLPRVLENIRSRKIEDLEIIPYRSEHRQDFKKMMFQWFADNYYEGTLDTGPINHTEKMIDKGELIVLLAKTGCEIIGAAAARIYPDEKAELLYLYIDELWRMKKIGKKLTISLFDILISKKIRKLEIKLNNSNKNMEKIFTGYGFGKYESGGPVKSTGTTILYKELK